MLLVKKLAYGDFFDDFCTVCLQTFGSPGGKRRATAILLYPLLRKGSETTIHAAGFGLTIGGLRPSDTFNFDSLNARRAEIF